MRILIFVLFVSSHLFSQNISGVVNYFVKYNDSMLALQDTKNSEDEEFNRQSKEAYKLASEVNFELKFNRIESIYTEIKKLENPVKSDLMVGYDLYDCGDIYTNLKTKRIYTQQSLFEKDFLIDEPLVNYNWKLLEETKMIGNYLCNKAVAIIPVSKEQLDRYEKLLDEYSKKRATILPPKEPMDIVITAWYSNELPIGFGPEAYNGLPGLILELHDIQKSVYCTKLVLNPNIDLKIKPLNIGKRVSQKEFDQTCKKMWDQYSEIQK